MTSNRGAHPTTPGIGSCPTRKRMYATRGQAKQAARRMHEKKLKPYRCERCGWIHLGHKPQGVRNGTFDKGDWLASKGNDQ